MKQERWALVDFTDNPRRGYVVSLHDDQETAKSEATSACHLVTQTDKEIGDSIMMDEMDCDP
jgi:hypothetical protein